MQFSLQGKCLQVSGIVASAHETERVDEGCSVDIDILKLQSCRVVAQREAQRWCLYGKEHLFFHASDELLVWLNDSARELQQQRQEDRVDRNAMQFWFL